MILRVEEADLMVEIDWSILKEHTKSFAELGKENRRPYGLEQVEPFKDFFDANGFLVRDSLDEVEEGLTHRELLTRYILLNVVLDQGPDMEGVGDLLRGVTNRLYAKGIPYLHNPSAFIGSMDTVVDAIEAEHERVKSERSEGWAMANATKADNYCLYFAQSQRGIISTKVTDYIGHRWGVPLMVFTLIQKDHEKREGNDVYDAVRSHLDSFESAELMSRQVKSHPRYGFGSAIGDKACHLFAKNYLSIYGLSRGNEDYPKGWIGVSYEPPFDSNAGRVLLRSGFLTNLATVEEYIKRGAIRKGKGKGGTDHLRVTDIRDMKTSRIPRESSEFKDYVDLAQNYLRVNKGRPRMADIQKVPNLALLLLNKDGQEFSVADFDDGLMHIGTKFCFNTSTPDCEGCPISARCVGHNSEPSLITGYRT